MVYYKVGLEFLELRDFIEKNFNAKDWKNIGLLTEESPRIEHHGVSLIRTSIIFNEKVLESTLLAIIKAKKSNLHIIKRYIEKEFCSQNNKVIRQNNPGMLDNLSTKNPSSLKVNVSSQENEERSIVFAPIVFKIPEVEIDTQLVSVMMPFDESMTPVYSAIQSAATSAGFKCSRADNVWNDSAIIQDVFALIFESRIVVCDFTGKNPNVFYEAGIAHTLGKHVVPITQNSKDIPFDLTHHRYAKYKNNEQGLEELSSVLKSRFKDLSAIE